MSLGKRLFIGEAAAAAACYTDDVNPFTGTSADGGVALYTLDYDASDESDNYDGTPTDVEFGVDGEINWGARFNGSSSNVLLPNAMVLNTEDISVSFWVKDVVAPAFSYGTIYQGDGNDYFYITVDTNGEIRVYPDNYLDPTYSRYTTELATTSSNITDGNWHHIVVVNKIESSANGGGYKIYVDGSENASASFSSTLRRDSGNNTNGSSIGSNNAGTAQYFEGKIDQVRIFNKAISSDEVSTLNGETACVHTATTDTVNYQATNRAYYKFDSTALDETSNNHDGTENSITYEFGRYGAAADFNGSSSYISVAHNSVFNWGSNKTLSVWVKFDAVSSLAGIVSKHTATSGSYGWSLYLASSGKIQFVQYSASNTGSTLQSDNDAVVGRWYHICVTGNGVTNKLYIDGVENDSQSAFTANNITQDLVFGRLFSNATGYNHSGQIDQLRFYESTLDDTAVDNLYNEKQAYITKNASDPFGDSNEVAFYKMETASGINVADSTGTNTGVAVNVTFTSGSGLFGTYAADFNGSTSKITLNSTDIADVVTFDGAGSTDECTLSFWVKPDVATSSFKALFTAGYGLELYHVNSRFTCFSDTNNDGQNRNIDGFQTTSNTYGANEWHHVVFTHTPTAQNWYVNGVIDGSNTTTSYTPFAEPDATIGTFRSANPAFDNLATFEGLIDHVRIFDRVLDGDEVFKLYAEVIN